MNRSIRRQVIRLYEQKRLAAQGRRDQVVAGVYARHPRVQALDRALAQAGADRLLEAIEPSATPRAAEQIRNLKKERARLLSDLGLAPDFDQVQYSCSLCQDTGQVGGQACSCYQKLAVPLLMDASNMAHLAGMTFDRFDENLFSDQASPNRFQSKLSPRQQIRGLKKMAIQFVEAFEAPQTRSLLFVGMPGTGKTFLMASIGHELLKQGHSVLYIPAPALFDRWQDHRVLATSFNPDPVRLENSQMFKTSLVNSSLLMIDDLGTEGASQGRYGDLLGILDSRQGLGRKMVVSTNIDPAQFRDQYDERLLSRLFGGFSVYRFFGDDLRLSQNRSGR